MQCCPTFGTLQISAYPAVPESFPNLSEQLVLEAAGTSIFAVVYLKWFNPIQIIGALSSLPPIPPALITEQTDANRKPDPQFSSLPFVSTVDFTKPIFFYILAWKRAF